jgi:hypothetical protein
MSQDAAHFIARGLKVLHPRFWSGKIRKWKAVSQDIARLQQRVDWLQREVMEYRDDWVAARELVEGHGNAAKDWLGHEGFRFSEVCILGSGPSLLELSEAERSHIRAQATIGMNRYYLFDDITGIPPAFVCIADYDSEFARRIFLACCRKAKHDARPPLFLLERHFMPFTPPYLRTIYFTRPQGKRNLSWSSNLDAPLFNHCGTLSGLLNLCGILRLAPHIRLLGIDLDRPGYFFEEQRSRHPEYFGAVDDRASAKGVHWTMKPVGSKTAVQGENILTHWQDMMKELAVQGMRVSCPRSDALLVREGHCDCRPLT